MMMRLCHESRAQHPVVRLPALQAAASVADAVVVHFIERFPGCSRVGSKLAGQVGSGKDDLTRVEPTREGLKTR